MNGIIQLFDKDVKCNMVAKHLPCFILVKQNKHLISKTVTSFLFVLYLTHCSVTTLPLNKVELRRCLHRTDSSTLYKSAEAEFTLKF